MEAPARLAALRERLTEIGDLARLTGRVALGVATPRDLGALRTALRPLPAEAVFRVNSFPAAAAAPNGDLYVTWTSDTEPVGQVAYWSRSTNGGVSWSAPDRVFPAAFFRRLARQRLDLTPDEIAGGHCVALSRPKELAALLAGYA